MATVWIFGNVSNSLAFQWATFQHFTSKIGKGLAPRRKPTQQVRPWSRLAPVFFRTRFRKNSFSCGTFLLLKSSNEPFSLWRTDISRKVQSEERNLSCSIAENSASTMFWLCVFYHELFPGPVSLAKLGFDLLIVFIAMTTKIPRGVLPYFWSEIGSTVSIWKAEQHTSLRIPGNTSPDCSVNNW